MPPERFELIDANAASGSPIAPSSDRETRQTNLLAALKGARGAFLENFGSSRSVAVQPWSFDHPQAQRRPAVPSPLREKVSQGRRMRGSRRLPRCVNSLTDNSVDPHPTAHAPPFRKGRRVVSKTAALSHHRMRVGHGTLSRWEREGPRRQGVEGEGSQPLDLRAQRLAGRYLENQPAVASPSAFAALPLQGEVL